MAMASRVPTLQDLPGGAVHRAVISTSRPCLPNKSAEISFMHKNMTDLTQGLYRCCVSRRNFHLGHSLSEFDKRSLCSKLLEFRRPQLPYHKSRRLVHPMPFASSDDGVAVNGTPQTSSSSGMDDLRMKLTQSLQGEDLSSGLVQSIHDAARAIELAIQEHSLSSKTFWFSKAWLGIDKNASVKTLSYQAAVYSLLQSAIEISSRGDGRDRDVNLYVQRSLLRLSALLESTIRDELSSKQLVDHDWLWSHQHPLVVKTFVDLFERDSRFSAATMLYLKGGSSGSTSESDLSLLMLALSCLAAVIKLGSTKVSCQQFFSMVPDIIGRLMDMLLDFVPINKAYHYMKDIGLCREFLFHFGPRAASGKFRTDHAVEERAFWVDLVQNHLQRAIDRERIWSRLTTCESIEVLEKDLAIFGFFIALGRSTKSFLASNGFSIVDDHIESFIRYLITGSVLYYPQLSSVSSYQLYVEVVCEELDWLPFYQSNAMGIKETLESKDRREGITQGEAIFQVLSVCSYWMTSFIKYSTWLESPSNIKAARFLSKGHSKLTGCMNELGVLINSGKKSSVQDQGQQWSGVGLSVDSKTASFDKALESVEEALNRLEDLLQELHLSNSTSGKEHLKAACSDLERIRKLNKEAEFLEASFRAKAASLEQEGVDEHSLSSGGESGNFSNKESGEACKETEINEKPADRMVKKPRGFWSFLVRNSRGKSQSRVSADQNEIEDLDQVAIAKMHNGDSESNEIRRFELLRNELIELEKRVQRSTDDAQNDEESGLADDNEQHASIGRYPLAKAQEKESLFAKSIVKIRETSTDVWQGTQLLAVDVAAAMVLLRRALTGDDLTQKEKQSLRRTLTDLASVVPIGILMLLPVTAVGHAAMLAAIQRYVPSLIPSSYAPERLDLLRQLEKVKEMESTEMNSDETEGVFLNALQNRELKDP
ncbi:uncharacterized protein LOC120263388 isoform X2 [Dioscorea cayenensis subsp. rotundata]|uniref:Uncharacterized protein LOC120263388 isoform X2 n=1 Tax=Dioscorea cayennensis subsp. rotundata TaxID=55577 RepID=A0AB40BKS4_DIOCR|nr:uncharacterized protein LOC120263388 isoform X2 [Dioscorea cayenensis subsp. rotundata]